MEISIGFGNYELPKTKREGKEGVVLHFQRGIVLLISKQQDKALNGTIS